MMRIEADQGNVPSQAWLDGKAHLELPRAVPAICPGCPPGESNGQQTGVVIKRVWWEPHSSSVDEGEAEERREIILTARKALTGVTAYRQRREANSRSQATIRYWNISI